MPMSLDLSLFPWIVVTDCTLILGITLIIIIGRAERAHPVVQQDCADCMYVYPERKEARLRRRRSRERLAAETKQRETGLSKAPCSG